MSEYEKFIDNGSKFRIATQRRNYHLSSLDVVLSHIVLSHWTHAWNCPKNRGREVPTREYPKLTPDADCWDSKEISTKCQGDQFKAFIRGTSL